MGRCSLPTVAPECRMISHPTCWHFIDETKAHEELRRCINITQCFVVLKAEPLIVGRITQDDAPACASRTQFTQSPPDEQAADTLALPIGPDRHRTQPKPSLVRLSQS